MLETSVYVQDWITGEIERFEREMVLGGAGPDEWEVREDVKVGVYAEYDDKNPAESMSCVINSRRFACPFSGP